MQSIGEQYIERREEGQDSIPTSRQWKRRTGRKREKYWHGLIHCEERVASDTMFQSKIYTVQKVLLMWCVR